jgi:uracil phosphoribosyltransferase
MADASRFPSLIVVDHPLVRHKLTLMRRRETPTPLFRALMKDIGSLLTLEATRALPVNRVEIETPVAPTRGYALAAPPLVVPILRAGMGMAEGVLAVMTEAEVGFIGVYRDETTLEPVEYLSKLPPRASERAIVVVDPMLATGHSGAHAIKVLTRAGARPEAITFLCLVAAPEGVAMLTQSFPQVRIVTAALDERLNERAYIVPGLGDAGDRLYGTV